MSKYKMKTILSKRVFLNDDRDMVGVGVLHFYKDEWYDEGKGKKKVKRNSLHGTMTLGDCNRIITLELDGGSKASVKKSLNKLKRIKDLVDSSIKVLEDRQKELNK